MLNMREKHQARHHVNGVSEISWLNLAPCWGDWFGVAGVADEAQYPEKIQLHSPCCTCSSLMPGSGCVAAVFTLCRQALPEVLFLKFVFW